MKLFVIFIVVALIAAAGIVFYLLYRRSRLSQSQMLVSRAHRDVTEPERYVSPAKPDDAVREKKKPTLERLSPEETHDMEEEVRVVGVVKPVGQWSQMIWSERMHFLSRFNLANFSGQGFWQALINAQRGTDQKKVRNDKNSHRR